MVLKKFSIQRVKYGTIIKGEGKMKATLENPKAVSQICNFELLANDLYL